MTDSSVSSSVSEEYYNFIIGWMTFTATLVYTIQIVICTVAFGFWGHKYSYLSYDIFNRLDFVATVGCFFELIALQVSSLLTTYWSESTL